jgi:hypothetical protein
MISKYSHVLYYSLLDIHGPSFNVDTTCSSGLIVFNHGAHYPYPILNLTNNNILSCSIPSVRSSRVHNCLWCKHTYIVSCSCLLRVSPSSHVPTSTTGLEHLNKWLLVRSLPQLIAIINFCLPRK